VELQRVLPGISTEQLRSRLNRMVADGMLTRKRYREVPPRVDYELTERARQLTPILGELARWGYEWAWGTPRTSESVDLGAIFRLIPGLVKSDSAAAGKVELVVSDGRDGEPASYVVTMAPGEASLVEGSDPRADAHVRGTVAEWIRALSPIGARHGLRSTGDHTLATTLLDMFALGNGREALDAGAESAAG
jgi:hypothetical protein